MTWLEGFQIASITVWYAIWVSWLEQNQIDFSWNSTVL
jgi:hypothetical protein